MKRSTQQLLLVGGSDDDVSWVHRALATASLTARVERLGPDEDPGPLLAAGPLDAVLVDLLSSRLDAAAWVALLEECGCRAPLVVIADPRQEAEVAAWLATGAADWVFRPGFLGLGAVLARLEREERERAAAQSRERQLREATAALVELARSPTFMGDDLTAMMREVTRSAARGMQVDRVGVWLYSEDRATLQLVDLFDAATRAHSHGTRLARGEHPASFAALRESRGMPATHAQTDPRTREFAWFVPEGITSTLDVAVRLRGEPVGAICVEHRGAPRRFTAAEEVLASALSDVVSLALESCERRRVERALSESERRFRDIFHFSSDSIVLYRVSLDGRVFCEDLNPACERSAGLVRDAVIGHEAPEVLDPIAAARLRERYAQAISARAPIVYEHVLPMPSGPRVYNTALVPLFDEAGRVHRLASVARDVTARHDTEQLSRRLEAQLAEAQKGEALARLATHVANDVTFLLDVVEAHAHQLQQGASSAAQTSAILEATARGRALTQQLTTVGRRRPEQRRPVELEPMLDEVLREASARSPAIELVRAVTAGLVVSGDAGQLRQVVVSLVANALEAMPDGGRCTVTLTSTVVDDGFAAQHHPLRTGRHARLEVEDTGRGLDPPTRRRLFEPYFSATGRDAGKADGLGLSLVQAVVTGHDGAVLVHSEQGHGTRFEVYLPVVENAVDQPGGGRHLMLVDDHPGMARVSAKLLETLGYRTSVFDDPREALEAFRLAPLTFDAVMTDLSMPQMSGEDFTRSLHELRPTLPVIVSSGMATALDRAQLERLGVSAVLLKPWRLEEAVSTLQRVLALPT